MQNPKPEPVTPGWQSFLDNLYERHQGSLPPEEIPSVEVPSPPAGEARESERVEHRRPLLMDVQVPPVTRPKPRSQAKPCPHLERTPEDLAQKIGLELFTRRTVRNLSLKEVAMNARIGHIELRHIERGKGTFKVSVVRRICAVLDLDYDQIIGGAA